MKYALISTNEKTSYISSWSKVDNKYEPVYTILGNRIAETNSKTFDVYHTLFWKECDDEVMADLYYYDDQTLTIKKIPENAPYPDSPTIDPTIDGAENF
jgi:hypothetical protein